MSASANTQVHVPRPKVWQAFEKGSAHLWRKILSDPSLHRFGRNGQAQHGMDMFGYRDGDTGKVVGVQCKCKGLDEKATEAELRHDFEKALAYEPKLTEYFFTTTADDDGPLQTFAAKLAEEQRLLGRNIVVRAWGWGTLEDEISAHPEVALVFDPNHSPTAEIQAERHSEIVALHIDTRQELVAEFRAITAGLLGQSGADATSSSPDPAEAALDAEIDRYRDRANDGKPLSSLDLLLELLKTLTEKNSGHIWFRVKANIAHCYLRLGDEASSADMLEEAVAYAPDDPKAAANAVLAMMLRGRHQEALDRALVELEKAPENEALAGYAVQAGGYAGVADAIDRIPQGLRDSEAVRKYHLINLRNAGDMAWFELARQGRSRDEKDQFYIRQAAEADIAEIVEGDHKTTWILEEADRLRLRRSAQDLIELWQEAKKNEAPDRPENLALCVNASLALVAVGDGASARDLMADGLAVSQGKDPELLVRVAAIALEVGDKALAEEVFPKLGKEGPALLMRAQIAARYGKWDYLDGIAGTEALDTIPPSEREVIRALASSATVKKIAGGDPAAASSVLNILVDEYVGSGRASVLIAQMAEELGQHEAAARAYGNALTTVSDKSHIASRMMIAGYATRRHDHAAVIRLMDGFVDTTVDSEELFDLASAFAYEFPPRARAVDFFRALTDSIRNSKKYALLEGIMHYHRGELGLAEERFIKARELSPDRIRPILMHVQTLLRLKRKSELPALVADLNVGGLKGSPIDQVCIAQVLAAGGRVDDALELAFDILDANRNDPKVALKWLGLCLGQLKRLHELSDAPIGVDMWTRLTSDDSQTNEFLVVDGPGEPAERKFGTGHSIAEAAIGHKVGDEFVTEDRIGRIVRWNVEQVRHKYLHAYEDLTENFNTRFPGEDGFFVIRTIDDDIEPFLDIMKRQGEKRQKLLELYTEGPLPISVLVELSGGGDVIRFTDSLRMHGHRIEACDGTLPERGWATGVVKNHLGKGIVLDTLTYWAVVGIDGLHVLKTLFGTVYLARSTADEIGSLHDDDDLVPGTERAGTSYFHNGQHYFDEFTPERGKQIADAIAKRENAMNAECLVVPVHAPDDIDPRLVEHIHQGAWDPIFVARERGLLLISDDKRYRKWAGSQKVAAVWLQAAFLYAQENRHIGAAEYARLIAQLASLGHTAITCNASDIFEVVAQATPETKYTIDAIADAIGVKDAEIVSHVRVTTEAIEKLWDTRPSSNAEYAIGVLMRNLIRYRESDRSQIVGHLKRVLSHRQGGKAFFDRWKAEEPVVEGIGPESDLRIGKRVSAMKASTSNRAVKARAKRLHRRAFNNH